MMKDINKKFISKNKGILLGYIGLLLVNGVLPIILSWQISQLMNEVLNSFSISKINILPFLLLAGYLLISYGYQRLSMQLVAKYKLYLLKEVNGTILNDGVDVIINNHDTNEYAQKIINESENLATFYLKILPYGLSSILFICIITSLIFFETIGLGMILILTTFIYLCVLYYFGFVIKRQQEIVMNKRAEYFGNMELVYDNIEQIRYYHLYETMKQKVYHQGLKMADTIVKMYDIEQIQEFLLSLFNYLFIAFYIFKGNSPLSNLFYMITILNYYFVYIDGIEKLLVAFKKNKVSYDFLNSSMSIVKDGEIKISKIETLEFQSFKSNYQKCQPIFQIFEKGHIYCIVGQNGVGKSTLFNCLLKFNPNYEGKILINGIDIKEISYRDLYNHRLYFMNQNCDLIEYVDSVDEHINNSRGEKQKQLISGMLFEKELKDCIILLDEPTASLDVWYKEKIFTQLHQLSQNNIIIVISHDDFVLNADVQKVRLI